LKAEHWVNYLKIAGLRIEASRQHHIARKNMKKPNNGKFKYGLVGDVQIFC
jgi:hypothetical protein